MHSDQQKPNLRLGSV